MILRDVKKLPPRKSGSSSSCFTDLLLCKCVVCSPFGRDKTVILKAKKRPNRTPINWKLSIPVHPLQSYTYNSGLGCFEKMSFFFSRYVFINVTFCQEWGLLAKFAKDHCLPCDPS